MELSFCHGRLSVACALSIVVLLSVALGRTVPDSLVRTTPGPSLKITEDIVHVDPPVERPVVSENLVAGVPVIVATCNNPLIREDCKVYLAAYGLEDSPRTGYVRTSGGSSTDMVPSDSTSNQNRGLTIFELDATTCTTRNRQRFDTHEYPDDRMQLLEALQSATTGTIIVGVTADSAENGVQFQNSSGSYFARYNMNLSGLAYRDKFAFIMQKGYPKKTIFQRKYRGGTGILMTVSLSGYTVADVSFRAGP